MSNTMQSLLRMTASRRLRCLEHIVYSPVVSIMKNYNLQ